VRRRQGAQALSSVAGHSPSDDVSAAAALLVDAAAQALVLVASAANDNSGVSAAQLRVLGVVRQSGTINLTQLAEALHTAPSSASRLCDRLEAADLLRRTIDGRDRREVWLVLTPTAGHLLDNLAEARQTMIAAVLRGMPVDQRAALVEGLQAFSRAAGSPAVAEGTAQAS
jgi:DNA-binding MarR family transcriptional regulator